MTFPTDAIGPTPELDPAAPPAPRSRASRLIRGSSWRVLAQLAPLFVNLALTPYVITTLGRVGYGLWLVASTLTQFIAHFDGGIGRSAQHYFAVLVGRDDPVGVTRLLTTLSLIVVCLGGVLLVPTSLFAPAIASFFSAPPEYADDTVFLLRVLLVLVGVGLLRNLFAAALHAHERFGLTSVSTLVSYVAYAAGMFLVLENGLGLRGVAYAFIAQHVVATFFIIPPALTHLTRRGVGLVPRAQLVDFARVSWRVQVSGIFSIASLQGVILVVGRLRPAQVPDFGPGATFAQQLKLIPMNGVAPIQAMLGRSVGVRGAVDAAAEFTQIQRMWVAAVSGWTVVGAPAAYIGVNVWLPLEGHLAGQVAAIMLVAHLLALLPQVLLQWLLLVERPQHEMWSSGLTVLVLVGLSLVLVPLVGALGAAIAAAVGQAVGLVLLLRAARGLEVRVPSPWSCVPWWQMLIAGALSAVSVWAISLPIDSAQLPAGGLGLLLCGAAAAPAMLLYTVLVWGPRKVGQAIRGRLRRRK